MISKSSRQPFQCTFKLLYIKLHILILNGVFWLANSRLYNPIRTWKVLCHRIQSSWQAAFTYPAFTLSCVANHSTHIKNSQYHNKMHMSVSIACEQALRGQALRPGGRACMGLSNLNACVENLDEKFWLEDNKLLLTSLIFAAFLGKKIENGGKQRSSD